MTSRSNLYAIGYGKPPRNHRFRKGRSGNPSGKRGKASAPDLRAQLQSALNKTVILRSGKHRKALPRARPALNSWSTNLRGVIGMRGAILFCSAKSSASISPTVQPSKVRLTTF